MSRYERLITAFNRSEQYREVLESKGVLEIEQYRTPVLDFDDDDLNEIQTIKYVWKYGDLYWKISSRFYDDPQYWWIIALWNRAPTEGHLKVGQTIKIPSDLVEALRLVQ
jgi:nucleoid-associated protein YgaU